ncbi:MAG: hypothetical protein V1870_04140 [Candidatus Aenigmatarchaeota archaeon]
MINRHKLILIVFIIAVFLFNVPSISSAAQWRNCPGGKFPTEEEYGGRLIGPQRENVLSPSNQGDSYPLNSNGDWRYRDSDGNEHVVLSGNAASISCSNNDLRKGGGKLFCFKNRQFCGRNEYGTLPVQECIFAIVKCKIYVPSSGIASKYQCMLERSKFVYKKLNFQLISKTNAAGIGMKACPDCMVCINREGKGLMCEYKTQTNAALELVNAIELKPAITKEWLDADGNPRYNIQDV